MFRYKKSFIYVGMILDEKIMKNRHSSIYDTSSKLRNQFPRLENIFLYCIDLFCHIYQLQFF